MVQNYYVPWSKLLAFLLFNLFWPHHYIRAKQICKNRNVENQTLYFLFFLRKIKLCIVSSVFICSYYRTLSLTFPMCFLCDHSSLTHVPSTYHFAFNTLYWLFDAFLWVNIVGLNWFCLYFKCCWFVRIKEIY